MLQINYRGGQIKFNGSIDPYEVAKRMSELCLHYSSPRLWYSPGLKDPTPVVSGYDVERSCLCYALDISWANHPPHLYVLPLNKTTRILIDPIRNKELRNCFLISLAQLIVDQGATKANWIGIYEGFFALGPNEGLDKLYKEAVTYVVAILKDLKLIQCHFYRLAAALPPNDELFLVPA